MGFLFIHVAKYNYRYYIIAVTYIFGDITTRSFAFPLKALVDVENALMVQDNGTHVLGASLTARNSLGSEGNGSMKV